MEDESKRPKQEVKLEINLDEETAQGIYSNLALINHGENEFIIDFIFVQPQQPKAKVRTRVITSPRHFKRLVNAMQENLERYEKRFGIIDTGSMFTENTSYQ
jgi:hypothetical protein